MTLSTIDRSEVTFDPAPVRDQFAIFRQDKPVAYLDNAASAQKPDAVIAAMCAVMETHYANVHRGLHRWANETTEAFEAARAKVAWFFNAEGEDCVVWARGSTEALNLVAHGIGTRLEAGDEIILSLSEHHANIVPWQMLAGRIGVKIVWVAPQADGEVRAEDVIGAFTGRTRVVALTHMSNVLGVENDVAAVCAAAREVGIVSVVDGSQSAVHVPDVDVQAMGADAYVFTGHKLYGPTGIGALIGRRDFLEKLPAWQGGGEMIARVTTEGFTTAPVPARFEAGTPAIVEAIGLGAAMDWVSALDRHAVAAHEAKLGDQLRDGLADMDGVRVFGRQGSSIISFHADWAHAHDLAQVLDHYGVAIRAGAHCAEPLMHHLEVTASARASVAAYNAQGDIDRCLDAMHKARRMFG